MLSEDTAQIAATFNTNKDKTKDNCKMILTDMQYGNGMERNASYSMAGFCSFHYVWCAKVAGPTNAY